MIKRVFSAFWAGVKKLFEYLLITVGFWFVAIFGAWLLITPARSATLGFGIAVAGIAVGAGIAGGIYFTLRNKKEMESESTQK